jgi:hypothetical protein
MRRQEEATGTVRRRAHWDARIALLLVCVSIALSSATARARDIRAAVFDLDFVDTSLEGASGQARDDEARRLALAGEMLRRMLAERGLTPVDLAPARERIAKAAPLTRCNGCELDLARELGAELAVTGLVQKISNLILNINVTIRDVRDGRTLRGGSVDIRGNTQETWSRGISYLVRNRLFDPPLALCPPRC